MAASSGVGIVAGAGAAVDDFDFLPISDLAPNAAAPAPTAAVPAAPNAAVPPAPRIELPMVVKAVTTSANAAPGTINSTRPSSFRIIYFSCDRDDRSVPLG